MGWHGMPTAHFKQIEITDNKVAKVTHQGETNHKDGAYKEDHVYDVTCLKEGETEVTFLIGNSRTKTQEDTVVEQKTMVIKCAMPSKLTFKYEAADESKLSHHPKFNRVLANKDKALKLTYTLKDKTGATFHNTDSLNIEAKVSDDSIIEPESNFAKFPEIEVSELVKLPGKPIHILRAKGKDGPVDLKVKLAGYNQAVLDLHGITDAPALPKVIDDDEDMDYEDTIKLFWISMESQMHPLFLKSLMMTKTWIMRMKKNLWIMDILFWMNWNFILPAKKK